MPLETKPLPEPSPSDVERFWEKVVMGVGGCYLWTSTLTHDGYPRFWLQGKQRAGHRVAYRIEYGEIDSGMLVTHKCHTPRCVRPDHLKLATHQENMRDRQEVGNYACGEDHPRSVLSEEDVLEIRRRHAGGESYGSIASSFEISEGHLGQIISGYLWGHV